MQGEDMTKPPLTRDPTEVLESLRRTLEAKKKAAPPEAPQYSPKQSAAVIQLSRIADSSPSLKEAVPKEENYKPLTRAQNKLLDASVDIFAEPATTKDAAFMARELVQTSLPHKNPAIFPCGRAQTAT